MEELIKLVELVKVLAVQVPMMVVLLKHPSVLNMGIANVVLTSLVDKHADLE